MCDLKTCKQCKRELPKNTDYFFKKKDTKDGFTTKCKECMGKRFTKYLDLKDGEMICKGCKRILPYDDKHFPIDKSTKTGLRNVCYECKGKAFGKRRPMPKNWTKEEDNILKEVYPDNLNKDILHLFLNRTEKALTDRAAKLGISKSEIALEKKYKAHSDLMVINCHWIGVTRTKEEKEYMSETMKNKWKENPEKMLAGVRYERTFEHREYLSELKKESGAWKGKNNPRHKNPLYGSDNGRWQGGITPLLYWLRNQLSDWKQESMKFHGYKCVITGQSFEDIHHLYSFNNIAQEALENISFDYKKTLEDFTDDEINMLRESIISTNNKYGYGVCLTKAIHKCFHDNYGYGNNTPEQFEEFKERYRKGEFKKNAS